MKPPPNWSRSFNEALRSETRRIFSGGIRRRLIRGSGWLLAGSFIGQLCAFVQALLLASYLGAKDYGVLALVIAYPTLVNQFLDGRSWETVVKFVSTFRASHEPLKAAATLKAVFLADITTGALAFFVVLGSSRLVAQDFLGVRPDWMILYAMSIPLSAPSGAAVGVIRVAERYSWISFLEVTTATGQLIGSIVVVLLGGGVREVVICLTLVAAFRSVACVTLATYAFRATHADPWRRAPLAAIRSEFSAIARFWVSTNGFAILKGLHQNADTLLLGHLAGPAATGIYRFARGVATLISFPLTPVYQATYPELAKLWNAGEQGRAIRMARLLSKGSSLALAVVLAVTWVLSPYLFSVVGGGQYAPALPAFRWLSLAVAISVVAQYSHALLMSAGLLSKVLFAFAVPLTAQLIALLLLVPIYGLNGAVIALLIFALVRAVMLWFWVGQIAASIRPPHTAESMLGSTPFES